MRPSFKPTKRFSTLTKTLKQAKKVLSQKDVEIWNLKEKISRMKRNHRKLQVGFATELGIAHQTVEKLKGRIETDSDTWKSKEAIDFEWKKTSRKQNLETQFQLREAQERKVMEAKPWRLCEICTEEFSEDQAHSPRVLDCGHTICYTCVSKLFSVHGHLQCPNDRQVIRAPGETIADLPINFLVLHM